jgi:cell division protein FtsW (lipid II flippase)
VESRRLRGAAPRYNGETARKHKPDYWLLVISALLLTIGLVVVYSISPGLSASQHVSQGYFVTKQLVDVVLGIATFALASLVPVSVWRKSAKPLAAAALIGSLIVMVTPIDEVYQAHRWIRLAGFSFQVAELIKLALLMGVASFLAQRWRENRHPAEKSGDDRRPGSAAAGNRCLLELISARQVHDIPASTEGLPDDGIPGLPSADIGGLRRSTGTGIGLQRAGIRLYARGLQ